jgi:hypothetical protein
MLILLSDLSTNTLQTEFSPTQVPKSLSEWSATINVLRNEDTASVGKRTKKKLII